MGFVEVEQFALAAGVAAEEFARRDAALQEWTYAHRPGLLRRTTALGDDGVLVLTLFGGTAPPASSVPSADADAPLASYAKVIDPATYRRAVYRDLG